MCRYQTHNVETEAANVLMNRTNAFTESPTVLQYKLLSFTLANIANVGPNVI